MKGQDKLASSNDGIIYSIVNRTIIAANYLCLVELFKFLSTYFSSKLSIDSIRRRRNIAIDIFIIAKWSVVIIFWASNYVSTISIIIVWYLLLTNIQSYFYNHVWLNVSISDERKQIARERRRFIAVILAFCFSIVCYGYFYHRCYYGCFKWPRDITQFTAAITFSIGNALTAFSGELYPNSDFGYFLVNSQLVITFLFIAIILTQSIPQLIKNKIRRK